MSRRKSATARRGFKLLAPLAGLGCLLALWPTGLAQQLENLTVDWRFKARAGWDPPAHPDLLVVGIGEYSLERLGRWPWVRSVHGEFLANYLTLRPPKAVAFDLLFTEPSQDPAMDEALADGLAFHPGAITAAFATDDGRTNDGKAELGKSLPLPTINGDPDLLVGGATGPLPVPIVAESSWTGFVNAPPSMLDGVRRHLPLVVRYGDEVYPALILQCLMQALDVRPADLRVTLGDSLSFDTPDGRHWRIPIDRHGRLMINYRGRERMPVFDYAGLIERLILYEQSGDWPEEQPPVQDQILLIGQTAEGLTDFGPTPHRPEDPLVLVHANALNTILQQDYLTVIPLPVVLAGWLLLAWACLWWMERASTILGAIVPLGLVAVYGGLAMWLFARYSVQLPMFLPIAGFVLLQGGALTDRLLAEMRAKGRIKNMFGTYVSPEVVDQMVDSGEEPRLGGETAEITAFFSDVESFSSFSEKLPAERLVSLMIEYLTEMTETLQFHGGTLDKYIGDAIVGMFGAPQPFPDHAHRACLAAIDIQQRQQELREKWKREPDWPSIVHRMRTRVGLNTGDAVIGNMGSPRRFNYTMMGDNVNLAARCESGAKSYGVFTMVTGETRRQSIASQDDIGFRFLDRIIVKGRTRPVEMFEVMGRLADLDQRTQDCMHEYQLALNSYFDRRWDEALAGFERAAALEPRAEVDRVHPSSVMRDRCRLLKTDPPAEDWDGVFRMTSK